MGWSASSSTQNQKQKDVKEETKTNKLQCPVSVSKSKIHEGSPNGTRKTMEEMLCGTDLSLE